MWLSSTAFKISPLLRSYKTTAQESPVQGSAKASNLLHMDSFRTQRQGLSSKKSAKLVMKYMNYGITLIRPNEKESLLERLHPQRALEHLQKAKTVAFGDSHGNGLMLAENLVMFGLLNITNKKSYLKYLNAYRELEENARPVYKKFIEIRDKTKDYTYTPEMQAEDQKWQDEGGEVAQAKRLLKLIELQKQAFCVNREGIKTKKAIFVGDELCDRAPSDWLLLEVLAMIREHKDAKHDTLVFNLSNHAIDYYKAPQSVGKDLASLAKERKDFLNDHIREKKGIKSLYGTRSMGDTYRWINALPDDEEKTTLFKEYQDLLRKQYESHTLIHQEGHVVTTHAFVSQATEKAWRHFLHRLDAQTFSDKDTPLHLQSGKAYQETVARINALTHDYLHYCMTGQQKGSLEQFNTQQLNFLSRLIFYTVDEREKPFHPPMIHGGFRRLEEAGFVPPADLCNGKTPHRIYGHTGTKDEPANGLLDKLIGLWVSCLNHTVRKFEDWQNLYVRKPGKQGKPHKENPVVIIN